MLRYFVRANVAASKAIDRLLPQSVRTDGNSTFRSAVLPEAVRPGENVFEFGGGSQPFLSAKAKSELAARVVGVDIDRTELLKAPEGAYDEVIVADICKFRGSGNADVVICQATLEHVPDTAGAIKAISSTLKPGGRAYIFAPCKNAAFAKINLMLPEHAKRRMLFALFPQKALGHDGFEAFYDKCTPGEIEKIAIENGLEVDDLSVFWTSSYFFIFTPAYILWRLYQSVNYVFRRRDAAETFSFIFHKRNS